MFVLLWVTFAVEAFALLCDAHKSLTKFAAVHSKCLKLFSRLWLQLSVAVELICEGLCCVPAVSRLSSLIADEYGVTHSASARQIPDWLTCYMEPEISFILVSIVFSPLPKWGTAGLTLGHRIFKTHSSPCGHARYHPFLSSVFSWFPLSCIKSSYIRVLRKVKGNSGKRRPTSIARRKCEEKVTEHISDGTEIWLLQPDKNQSPSWEEMKTIMCLCAYAGGLIWKPEQDPHLHCVLVST